jgi:hypothetical protein
MRNAQVAQSENGQRWLLPIHQLRAKLAGGRAKIWRRLHVLGTVAVKNAVHALPASERSQEDPEWLRKEILEAGGEAMICEARLINGPYAGTRDEIARLARGAAIFDDPYAVFGRNRGPKSERKLEG